MKQNAINKECKLVRFTLLSIDAWKDGDGGWFWNNWYVLEDGIFIEEKELTSRKILAFLRKADYLSEQSKGVLTVENDGYNYNILNRKTMQPLLALDYGSNWEYNGL